MYKVLIVEDDPMVAMIHRQFLVKNPSFQVVGTCVDGIEALTFLKEREVDLAILDVHMPRLEGLGLLREIRQNKLPVSVVMVTAANDVQTVQEALRLGALDYLIKPFTYLRFQAALEKFVAQKTALAGVATLDQAGVDNLIGPGSKTDAESAPKGIQEKTVQILTDCLKNSEQEWLTGDEIAEQVKLSSVTVRRYMNHLMKAGIAEGKMDYETGGRPRLLYRCAPTTRQQI